MILRSLFTLFDLPELPNYPVAIRHGITIPFSKFRADVTSVASNHVPCRAALICEDSYHFLVGLFGLLAAGCEIVVFSSSQSNCLDKLSQEFDIVVDDTTINTIPPADSFTLLLDPDRPCIHFFTSGSTGIPKRITKTLAMLESEVTALDKILTHEQGTVFSTVPHYHMYGFIYKLIWPLVSGRPFDTVTYGLWEGLLSQLTPHSFIISSPAHLRRLAGIAAIEKMRMPAQIISAGAPLSFANAEDIYGIFGCYPTEIFGSTETGTIATRTSTQEYLPWQPLVGIAVTRGEDKRMSLLSPHVGKAWYLSDDLIDLVPGGFHFLGRADSIVKVEGKRVSLTGVEWALCELPWIKEAAVILLAGVADRLAAVIVLTPEGELQLSKFGTFRFSRLINQALEGSLERVAMPRLWRFVSCISTKGIGKRQVADLHALFEDAL